MHPGAGNYDKTIVNALMHYDKNSLSTIGDELRPGIVHRIDKNTSGLVVIAKNNETHENLSRQFSDHTITRIYQLLIWGKLRPSTGRIDTFITRSSKNRQLMEVSRSKGKQAPVSTLVTESEVHAEVSCPRKTCDNQASCERLQLRPRRLNPGERLPFWFRYRLVRPSTLIGSQ
jgi:23S rRNA-/tRNA-specific pseudouridylate synthase